MAMVAVPATADNLPVVPAVGVAPLVLPTGAPAPGPPGRPRRGTGTIGTLLFCAADFMVLAAIVATYLSIKSGSAAWPPKGVHVGTYIPTLVSITVAMSGFAMQWAVFWPCHMARTSQSQVPARRLSPWRSMKCCASEGLAP